RTGTHLLHALDYNAFARLQPFVNNPHGAGLVANLDGSDTYFVICPHNSYLIAPLEFRDRALRNEQRTLSNIGRSADSAVAARAKNIFGVGKSSCDANGARGLIDLAVREKNETLMGIGIPIGQNQFERQ